MINLLIGPPGGGKSYEAVVFHILPALQAGRKVITNLPLELDRLALLGFDVSLVEVRTHTQAVEPEKDWAKAESLYKKFGIAAKPSYWVNRPFAHPEDYGHAWRHPVTGSGPLYVIDECHLALARSDTKREVEEWFSLHRHESADVLLITQSYGKVSKSIVDLVQICYRVKKGTAFGLSKNYIRKVQDGVRGEVVNTSVRTYEKKYFGLYKSHTRGGGSELEANDITPMWKRWPFVGAVLMFALAIAIFTMSGASINPLKNGLAEHSQSKNNGHIVSEKKGSFDLAKPDPISLPGSKSENPEQLAGIHPYSGRELHIIGALRVGERKDYFFSVSQNGQIVSQVDSRDLKKLGYVIGNQTDCAVTLSWEGSKKWIICDSPQVGVIATTGASETREGTRARAGGPRDSEPIIERSLTFKPMQESNVIGKVASNNLSNS